MWLSWLMKYECKIGMYFSWVNGPSYHSAPYILPFMQSEGADFCQSVPLYDSWEQSLHQYTMDNTLWTKLLCSLRWSFVSIFLQQWKQIPTGGLEVEDPWLVSLGVDGSSLQGGSLCALWEKTVTILPTRKMFFSKRHFYAEGLLGCPRGILSLWGALLSTVRMSPPLIAAVGVRFLLEGAIFWKVPRQ